MVPMCGTLAYVKAIVDMARARHAKARVHSVVRLDSQGPTKVEEETGAGRVVEPACAVEMVVAVNKVDRLDQRIIRAPLRQASTIKCEAEQHGLPRQCARRNVRHLEVVDVDVARPVGVCAARVILVAELERRAPISFSAHIRALTNSRNANMPDFAATVDIVRDGAPARRARRPVNGGRAREHCSRRAQQGKPEHARRRLFAAASRLAAMFGQPARRQQVTSRVVHL